MNGRAVTLETPEGISFALELAGPSLRFLAALVDMLAVAAASAALFTLAGALAGGIGGWAFAFALTAQLAVPIVYGAGCEYFFRGQTPGKRLLGLRVIDRRGLRLAPEQVLMRNLLRAVDQLPLFYLVGGIAALFSPRGQRLGDLAADTIVIVHRPTPWLDAEHLSPQRHNSLATIPHLAARLRRRASAAEAMLVVRALLRRESLAPEPRVALYARLAAHFRALVPYPEEVVDGLSDEAYLRAVAGVLFRRPAGAGLQEVVPGSVPRPPAGDATG